MVSARVGAFLFLLILVPGRALGQACDLYVNASDGDESNAGTSPATALRSIESAFTASASGGSVCVAAGEYFFGADADGISLTGQNKSVRFVLNAFAGQSQVLLSERSLAIDVGSGTVRFEAGTASQLRLGVGVFNSDAATGAANLNFVHTLTLRSGTLDVTSVTFTAGPSVGNPSFVNPTNSAKRAPATSAIHLGDGVILGSPVFESATSRTVIVDPSATQARALPSGLRATLLAFRNQGPVSLPGTLAMDGTEIAFENAAQVTVLERLSLANTGAITATGAADVVLAGGLEVSGPLPDTLLRHTGAAGLHLGPVSVPATTALLNAGGGTLTISSTTGRVDIHNRSGFLAMGSQQAPSAFDGALTNLATLTLSSPVTLTRSLHNAGTTDLQGHTLTLDGASVTGPGQLAQGLVAARGTVSIAAGSIPDLNVTSGTTRLESSSAGSVTIAGELVPAGTGMLSVDSANLAAGGQLASTSLTAVRINGPADLEGSVSLTGALELRGSTRIAGPLTATSVSMMGDALSLSASASLPNLTLEGSGLILDGQVTAQRLEVLSGSATASALVLPGGLRIGEGAMLTMIGTASLSLGANLTADGQLTGTPDVRFTGGGTHTLASAAPLEFTRLTLAEPGSSVIVQRSVTVHQSLDLTARAIQLLPGVVLTLGANISVSANSILGSGSLRFTGTAVQTLTGTGAPVIPASTVAGAGLRIAGGAQVQGALVVESGASVLAGVVTIAGNLEWTGGTLDARAADLRVTGPGRTLSLRSTLGVTDFSVTGAQSTVALSGALTVHEELWVDSGATLDLGASIITMTGSPGSGRVLVDGTYRDTAGGGVRLTGSADYVLEGAGLFGSLRISQTTDSRAVTVGPGTSRLRLSGDLFMDVGTLTTGSAPLELVATTRVPRLIRNVGDRAPANGTADGGLPRNTGGQVAFTAPSGYGVVIQGSLANVYEVGPELLPGSVRSLEVLAVDGINTNPVFGIRLAHSETLPGSFAVAEGAIVFLSRPLRVDAGTAVLSVRGRVSGHRLEVASAGAITGGSLSRLDSLRFALPPATPISLQGVASVGVLELHSGRLEVAMLSTPDATTVTAGLLVREAGTLAVRQRVVTGEGSILQIEGTLDVGARSSLYLGSGSSLVATASSSLVVGNLSQQTDSITDGGFVVAAGMASLNVVPPMPRLMLAATTAGSDDVILARDLEISDRLVTIDGDLIVGEHTLTISGNTWKVDTNSSPLDGGTDGILGQLGSTGSTVLLNGSTEVILGGPLDIQSAGLVVAGSATDTVRVSGPGSSISVSGAGVHLDSGVLSLGSADLILSATIPEVLRLSGGRVVSPATGSGTADGDWGEVVLGGGASSVRLVEPSHIDALRLRGSLTVETSGQTLTIGKRLVFGEDGASLLTPIPGLIRLGDSTYLLRRGLGTLTHAPIAQGRVHLIYDLAGRALPGGVLQSSEELLRPPVRLGAIRVNGGAIGTTRNTLRFTTNVHVDTLLVNSGLLDLNDRAVNLGTNGALLLRGTSSSAAPGVTRGSGLTATGPIALELVTPFHDAVLSEGMWPPALQVGRLRLSAGNGTAVRSLLLQADRTAGSVTVDMGSSSDQLVMNGFALAAQDSLVIRRGIVSSGPSAQLQAGTLVVGVDAAVRAPVSAVVEHLTVTGRFAGLFAQASGTVTVTGDFGDGASLILDGTGQTLSLTGDETFNSLVLNQAPGGEGVDLEIPEGSTLTLNGGITLGNGVLRLGGGTLRIPGTVDGFTRTVGNASYVVGRIERSLPAGFAGPVRFPTGADAAFRPLDLVFDTPLFSASTIAVTHFDSPPIGLGGLTATQGTSGFRWLVTSSVNFGQAQPLAFGAGASDTPQAEALLARDRGALSDWSPWGGEITRSTGPDGLFVSAPQAPGGLTPTGLELTFAVDSPVLATTWLQFAHLGAEPDAPLYDVFLDEAPLRLGSDYLDVSAVQPFAQVAGSVALHTASQPAFGAPPPGMPLALLTVGSTGRQFLAVVPGRTLLSSDVRPGSFVFIHGSVDLGSIALSLSDSNGPLISDLLPGQATTLLALPAGRQDLLLHSPDGTLRGSFRFDVPASPAQGAVLLLSGYADLPDGLEGTRGLRLRLLAADGTVQEAADIVGLSAGAEPPSTFQLHGNYPNPFNPRTRITFALPQAAAVRLEVFDLTGRQVRTIDAGILPAHASQSLEFDATGLASGVYLYRLSAGQDAASGRFVLLK